MIRGAIKYQARYKQLISYEGLERMRRITPTDIDGMIDYGGVCFLYLECKKEGKALELGQRKALENAIKSHDKAGHKSCAILFIHNNEPDEIIMAKDKEVLQIYMKRFGQYAWEGPKRKINLLQAVEIWEAHCKKLGICL